jgi:hypothetical protein
MLLDEMSEAAELQTSMVLLAASRSTSSGFPRVIINHTQC